MVEDTDNPSRVPGRLVREDGAPAPAFAVSCGRLVRLVGEIAAVVSALAIASVLYLPVGSRGLLLQAVRVAVQAQLPTLGAGLLAAGALLWAGQSFTLSRRTLKLTEWRQVSDRYAKAIEQLGSEKLDVRVCGIFALEHVARDSPRDHPDVMEVLTAFIREKSHKPLRPVDPAGGAQERSARPDVQAALTVVGRRKRERDIRPMDLTGSDLTGSDLTGADLTCADLGGATLSCADLSEARLRRANLHGADLRVADLNRAYLTRADLGDANLTRADLAGANLTGADLTCANLHGANLNCAYLSGADLSGADLSFANFCGTALTGARLIGANLASAKLTGAVLFGAYWPPCPPGRWPRDCSHVWPTVPRPG